MTNVTGFIKEWDKNKIRQLQCGIPNKISFLFYGIPGCGKSSTVYAIANETKKHIISINLQDMTNQTFLNMMAYVSNKIVLFEDIDAYEFTHKRDEQQNNEKKVVDLQLSLFANSKKNKNVSQFSKEMTLDVILDVLDGYSYLNNCIVIMTTNHPEKLDPALIRPGRVDHKIKFSLCDEYQFSNIFKYFTGHDYRKIDPAFKFKENFYMVSYLINSIIIPNYGNPEKILSAIL